MIIHLNLVSCGIWYGGVDGVGIFDRVMVKLFDTFGYSNLVQRAWCLECGTNDFGWGLHDSEEHHVVIEEADSWYFDEYAVEHTSYWGEIDFDELDSFWNPA